VVSTHPLASQALGRLRRTGRLDVPVAAVMTDPSVHPLCVAPGVDLHLAASTGTVAALRALGCGRAERTAPVVDPAFQPGRGLADAYRARRRWGLPPVDRLAVVLAGSLLHDSDHAAAPRCWEAMLAALPAILSHCQARGLAVGPLREHGLPRGRTMEERC